MTCSFTLSTVIYRQMIRDTQSKTIGGIALAQATIVIAGIILTGIMIHLLWHGRTTGIPFVTQWLFHYGLWLTPIPLLWMIPTGYICRFTETPDIIKAFLIILGIALVIGLASLAAYATMGQLSFTPEPLTS